MGFWATVEHWTEHERPEDGQKSKKEGKPEYKQNETSSNECRCNKDRSITAPENSRLNHIDCKCKEVRKEPPMILCWNAHGLISKEKKWKIDALEEQVSINNTDELYRNISEEGNSR